MRQTLQIIVCGALVSSRVCERASERPHSHCTRQPYITTQCNCIQFAIVHKFANVTNIMYVHSKHSLGTDYIKMYNTVSRVEEEAKQRIDEKCTLAKTAKVTTFKPHWNNHNNVKYICIHGDDDVNDNTTGTNSEHTPKLYRARILEMHTHDVLVHI